MAITAKIRKSEKDNTVLILKDSNGLPGLGQELVLLIEAEVLEKDYEIVDGKEIPENDNCKNLLAAYAGSWTAPRPLNQR